MSTEFLQNFGTGGTPDTEVTALGVVKHALTTSWQKFSVTATLPSVSGKTLGTNGDDKWGVAFWFDSGSDFNARNDSLGRQSGTFDIANVQVEYGDQATEFEFRYPETELALCQRYYCKTYDQGTFAGTATYTGCVATTSNSTGSGFCWSSYPVTMRSTPTVTAYSPQTGTTGNMYIGSDVTANINYNSDNSILINGTGSANVGATVQYTADSEL